ncbi:cuticle protein 7-like [Chrysoperla carnea]|uniref:cuticle protein 7-like n=1 Tax=Chrysoperla carnea TaxID=189513 RepID=UPI001D085ABE|nr:cuticle protein 7-like [Chrysoperla carnea]
MVNYIKICAFAIFVAVVNGFPQYHPQQYQQQQYQPQYQPVAVAYKQPVAVAYKQPVAVAYKKQPIDDGPQHDYAFEYSVNNPQKHDYHDRKEVNENGVIRGYYSLIEDDGTRRIVHYTADKVNGFHATVEKEGEPIPKVAAPVVVKAAAPAYAAVPQYYQH